MKLKTNLQSSPESSSAIVKHAVRGAYTFDRVKSDIEALRNAPDGNRDSTSLRKIAKKYGVTHGAIKRALDGKEPKDPAIRHALGLPPNTVAVSPLPCGHAELAKRCPICQPRSTTPNATRKRDKRIEAMRAGLQLARTLDSMTG